jgi:hypothetical protein
MQESQGVGSDRPRHRSIADTVQAMTLHSARLINAVVIALASGM